MKWSTERLPNLESRLPRFVETELWELLLDFSSDLLRSLYPFMNDGYFWRLGLTGKLMNSSSSSKDLQGVILPFNKFSKRGDGFAEDIV